MLDAGLYLIIAPNESSAQGYRHTLRKNTIIAQYQLRLYRTIHCTRCRLSLHSQNTHCINILTQRLFKS